MKRGLLAVVVACLAGCDLAEPVTVSNRDRAGGTDVTFFVAADAHLGADGMLPLNRLEIENMNDLPGTPYPADIGGRVDRPLGVLFAGDMTDHGRSGEWKTFEQLYGLTGREGLLKYPVFEGTGNHDRVLPLLECVPGAVRERHGGLTYSWDWADVHVVCLDLRPDAGDLGWLRRDLAAAGGRVPVIIYFHLSILGPYSDWWPDSEKEAFAKCIEDYNVIAIFHGHYHGSYAYKWKGLDVFNIGSPRHSAHRFLAVRVTDAALTVAAWDWDRRQWDWTFPRRINQEH